MKILEKTMDRKVDIDSVSNDVVFQNVKVTKTFSLFGIRLFTFHVTEAINKGENFDDADKDVIGFKK